VGAGGEPCPQTVPPQAVAMMRAAPAMARILGILIRFHLLPSGGRARWSALAPDLQQNGKQVTTVRVFSLARWPPSYLRGGHGFLSWSRIARPWPLNAALEVADLASRVLSRLSERRLT